VPESKRFSSQAHVKLLQTRAQKELRLCRAECKRSDKNKMFSDDKPCKGRLETKKYKKRS